MANGFGSLFVGASALRSYQTGLDVTANNISNLDTDGYVRQQVLYTDDTYTSFGSASVSRQLLGLGVQIGDVVHARDVFLDKAYRSEASRQSFYAASFDAVNEVEVFLQESYGENFNSALTDLYTAFSEFAKDPSDSVNQNLVVQKASLFISRAQSVYQGLSDYQTTINTKIKNDVNEINDLSKKIYDYNQLIQKIEAAGVETAMTLRDERDLCLDRLAELANISYSENNDHMVLVKLEGIDLVEQTRRNTIGMDVDRATGFVTPYWNELSDPDRKDFYEVFKMDNISAVNNTDKGEVKALLLARGDTRGTYMDMDACRNSQEYQATLQSMTIKNAQAELDTLIHEMVTSINEIISPTTTCAGEAYVGETVTVNGKTITITADTKIADTKNCSVGSDGKVPPEELFTRTGCDRFTAVNVSTGETIYLYNEENVDDTSTCYTMKSLDVNQKLVENRTLLAHRQQNSIDDPTKDSIDYALGAKLEAIWTKSEFYLNPSDTTPCNYTEFYQKWVSEIGTVGSVYETTSETLDLTKQSIENNRQAVTGVSSDEELTNMIRYQNAYNAASRYVSVVSEMVDWLLSTL